MLWREKVKLTERMKMVKTRRAVINLESSPWHTSPCMYINACFFFSFQFLIIMQTYYYFLFAVAITFNSVFCLTLLHDYFSMLLCRSHNQVHGPYNSLLSCMIIYSDFAIGHFSHMMLLKMEWATLLVGVWNGTTLLGKLFGNTYHRPEKCSLP